jgi:AraC-like DNA-binding protein
MERETGIEPATNSLEGCDSTIELLPLTIHYCNAGHPILSRDHMERSDTVHLLSGPQRPLHVVGSVSTSELRVAFADAVAEAQIAKLGDSSSLRDLCANVGVSVRTVERAFRREVGMNFETWRRQVRLMKAIELLVGGCQVKEAAFEVGYRQPSAFVEMFRRTLGTTPKVWISALSRETTAQAPGRTGPVAWPARA